MRACSSTKTLREFCRRRVRRCRFWRFVSFRLPSQGCVALFSPGWAWPSLLVPSSAVPAGGGGGLGPPEGGGVVQLRVRHHRQDVLLPLPVLGVEAAELTRLLAFVRAPGRLVGVGDLARLLPVGRPPPPILLSQPETCSQLAPYIGYR